MSLEPGQTLTHYRLLEKIGQGGMGVVWKALDTSLGREVALKLLPDELGQDAERLARLEGEARALAALNHPNIVTIHSIEEAEGRRFLAMELLPGRPLAELIPSDGFPVHELLRVARPVVEAVGAAHRRGVTHRDLKPGNVMVAEDSVKVLDFGLAQSPSVAPAAEVNEQPTRTLAGERLVGTLAYMAPGRIEGLPADARSDIFSLGVLLYEMATGRRPFDAGRAAALISSVLRDAPVPTTRLNPAYPPRLDRIVARCLEKDPHYGASLTPMETVKQAGPTAWFQAYLPGDPGIITPLVERAQRAGFEVLVLTVDVQVNSNRENNVRAGYSSPLKPTPRLAWDCMLRPRWLCGTFGRTWMKHGRPHLDNMGFPRIPILGNLERPRMARDGLCWEHVELRRRIWKGKLVMKGVVSPQEVSIARESGVAGIMVPNHGGRQLDGTVAPLRMLPAIAAEAGGMAIMMDSGIRRGTDVLKAPWIRTTVNMGVRMLDEFFRERAKDPPFTGEVVFEPMAPHCWGPRGEDLHRRRVAHMIKHAPAGSSRHDALAPVDRGRLSCRRAGPFASNRRRRCGWSRASLPALCDRRRLAWNPRLLKRSTIPRHGRSTHVP